jgi:enoyl-CoA hydratase
MKLERRDDVAVLMMNAGKGNAINQDWLARMEALLREVEASPARALVLTGYEGFFCAGLDLPSLVPLGRDALAELMGRFDDFMLGLFELGRPVVAAINGHAVAGGCVLALQADERLVADGAVKIGLNEVALAIGLPVVVVETLRCQVPASSLLPIALEAKLFTPQEALELGLVHRVVPQGELLDRAVARARELGAQAPLAFAQVKRQLRAPAGFAARQARAQGASATWLDTWFSEEGQKRLRAAVEKLGRKK